MPKVPLMSPDITPQATPEISAPPLIRPPEEAFGGQVAEAKERLGGAIMQSGQEIFDRMLEHKQREDAQQVLDVQTQFQQALQNKLINPQLDENQTPKGYLNRTLNQAKGSSIAFDQDALQLKNEYMNMVPGTIQKQQMNQILSTHLVGAREQVISHEAQQTQAAFDNSFQTNMKTTAANATGIEDPNMLNKYISTAQLAAGPGWQHSGLDEGTTEAAKKGYANEIAKAAILPMAEYDPKGAETLVNGLKPEQFNPGDLTALQLQVAGKKLDATILDVFDWSKNNARMADGQMNRAAIDKYVSTLDLSPQQELQVKMHVDRLASVDASEQAKIKQDQEKSFANDAITAQSKGEPVELFMKEAANPKYGNADPMTIANRQNEIAKLWSSPEERFNSWLNHSDQATQHAWSDVQDMVKTKYGNNVTTVAGRQEKAADSAIGELKEDIMGKSADQIRQIADDKLKKVTVSPFTVLGQHIPIFDSKAPQWQADAQNRENTNQRMLKLNSVYGEDIVFKAQQFVVKSGQKPSPENIQAAIGTVANQGGGNGQN